MYLSPVRRTCAVTRCSGLKPGLVRRTRVRVLSISPAQMSSTNATAISAITKRFRVRWRDTEEVERPSPRKVSFTSCFEARNAGASAEHDAG